MHFRTKRGKQNQNNIIPIIGLGLLIAIPLGLFQINYFQNFDEIPKEVRIYLNVEPTNPWSKLDFKINNQSFPINFNATKIDSLIKIQLIPKQSYIINLKLDGVHFYKKKILYLGEPNLLIDLKVINKQDKIKIKSENVELFMNLSI